MPQLSWPEVRDRALRFSREWAGTTSESAEKQTFWNEFFEVFGLRRRNVATFEEPVARIRGSYGRIDLFWPGTMLVEHKSAGEDLSAASSQAFAYIRDLAREGRAAETPRYVIVSDFARFVLYDLEPEDQRDLPLFDSIRYASHEFTLAHLHEHVRRFAFLRGERTVRVQVEAPANAEAYRLMCELHDALEDGGFTGADLERLLVRVLFCLFAEDNGIFPPGTFTAYIREQTRPDGGDLGAQLNALFDWLNDARADAPLTDTDPFAGFCYVNGQLFDGRLGFARFTREQRDTLLRCCGFQWARISPAVFGSLFQGIMEDRARRQQGAHYTSERDIMKLLRSLFLDDLRTELDAALADRSSRRTQRLEDFHHRLRALRFFDPACGCGNFLVLAYRELRRLEHETLRALHPGDVQQVLDVRQLLRVDVDQFHGLEKDEWPARIAEVALWLMDHQMNKEASDAFGNYVARLPLRTTPHIQCANALRTDWRAFLPPGDDVLVLGNPPFVGHHYQSAEQKDDQQIVLTGIEARGVLDYVSNWYVKAADYIQGTRVRCAFVSTNSITQGEQAGLLWNHLFQRYGIKIHFAHRTFSWVSEARGKAHVHVVIIGFAAFDHAPKRLYDYDADPDHATISIVGNISPYLVEGPDRAISIRSTPLCDVPKMSWGNKPTDGGHLILSPEERTELLVAEPQAAPFIRRYMSGGDFIKGDERYCLWLKDADPALLRRCPRVVARVEKVREFRLASEAESTRRFAAHPTLFRQIAQPAGAYLAVPEVSSENRTYIPMAYVEQEVICSNTVQFVPDARVWHFGILTSAMHMAWMRTVAGRLESRYRYSNTLVYNNYPWPADVTDAQRAAVESAAQAVLDARAAFPTSTLADLYDPLLMPAPLVQAHDRLDRAVDRCYRRDPFPSDRARVEHLFALYERLTAPLLPAAPRRRSRRAAV